MRQASLENIVISSKGEAFIPQTFIRCSKGALLPPPLPVPSPPQCSLLREAHLTLPSGPPTHSLTSFHTSTRMGASSPGVASSSACCFCCSLSTGGLAERRGEEGREGGTEGGRDKDAMHVTV